MKGNQYFKFSLPSLDISLSGPSQILAEEFAKAAGQLKKEAPGIRFGKVDITDQKDLKKEFNIQEFPTVKFFVDGNRKNPIDCKGKLLFGLMEVHNIHCILPFGVTASEEVFMSYGIRENAIAVFKKVRTMEIWGLGTDVEPFVLQTSVKIFDVPVENHILLFTPKNSETFNKTYEDYRSAAVEFRGKIMFILVDTNETRNGRVFEYFRITEIDVPAVRILNLTSDAKYKMPADEVTVENLRSFCHSYLGGKAKPHVSSEEIPEDWDKNPVKVLVGKNFNRVTFNKTKNVFVMFYAPWSHDCRKLLPIWDELGKKYEHHENIVIAKIDFTANDIQLVMLDRYPFFRFFPVGSNNQVRSIQCVCVRISGSKKFNSMIWL
uniref:Protein disulfide isomerase like, testis expressed n=1 Tax=Terrapene triunguis TaxID=2587831 RepID=A0A674JMH7_9SAUR